VAGHGGKHFVLTLGEHPAAARIARFPSAPSRASSAESLGKRHRYRAYRDSHSVRWPARSSPAWTRSARGLHSRHLGAALAVKVAGISNCCVGMRSTVSALLTAVNDALVAACMSTTPGPRVLRQDVDSGSCARRIQADAAHPAQRCRCGPVLQCGPGRPYRRCSRTPAGARRAGPFPTGEDGCVRARKGHRGADRLPHGGISGMGPASAFSRVV